MFEFLRRVDRKVLDKVAPTPPSMVRTHDPEPNLPAPLAPSLLAEIQAEIRLIRTMASTLRHVDRVRLAAKAICELAVDLLGVEMALVNLVGETTVTTIAMAGEWNKSETPLEEAYCPIVVGTGKPLSIMNSHLDDRVKDNLATTRDGVSSYLGVPLRTQDDFVIGALCVCGCTPRVWAERDEEILISLSRKLMDVEAEALREMQL
jgi:sigma-B regulation protein RsbU (phosphoserine phosphatase)